MRWGFIALSVILLLKPVIPWMEYLVNQEYIAANLCVNAERTDMDCHGSCYLKSNLENEFDQGQEPKSGITKLTWEITAYTADIRPVLKLSAFVMERLIFIGGMSESLYRFKSLNHHFKPPTT